jgi:superfamily I DNA/RNA helicase
MRADIIENTTTPTLIRAGPGSGKTHMLGCRLKWLLDQGLATSAEVTLLAYGRDASASMLTKLTDPNGEFRLDRESLKDRVSTMHALGHRVIERAAGTFGLKDDFQVLEDASVRSLLFRDAGQSVLDKDSDAVSREADSCKTHGDCSRSGDRPACRVCAKYTEIMRKCNFMDFDDQILLACELMEKDDAIRADLQSGAKHLLVDEYQDLNAAQRKMLKLLCQRSPNGIFIIGDDAQSIYSFRGGDPQSILQTEKLFPGITKQRLAESWRCHRNILSYAAKALSIHYKPDCDPAAVDYKGRAAKTGPPPYVWECYSMQFEAEVVARLAREFLGQKKEVLIMVPASRFYGPIAQKLDECGVPFTGPVPVLARKTEERLACASRLMRWVRKPRDNFAARLVMEELLDNGPSRLPGADRSAACTPQTIANRIDAELAIAVLWDKVDGRSSLYTIAGRNRDSHAALASVVAAMEQLEEAYSGNAASQPGEFAKRLSVLFGLWSAPADFADDSLALLRATRPDRLRGPRQVLLTTMKKAKGLEAHVVIVPGVEEGIVPDPRSDPGEDARLFYVTMTRAVEELFLLHSTRRPGSVTYGSSFSNRRRSRYLDAMGIASTSIGPAELKNELTRFRSEFVSSEQGAAG